MKAFVCDGRSRASLQVCRSLKKQGFEVHVGEAFSCSTFFSNAVSKSLIYPDPDTEPGPFFTFVKNYLDREKIDLLYPIRDSSYSIFSQNKSEVLKKTKSFLPDHNNFKAIQDKEKLAKVAKKLGVIVPKTIYSSDDKINNFNYASNFLGLPFIAKPKVSSGSRGIFLIKSEKSFFNFLNLTKNDIKDYFLQEYIPHGGAVGVYLMSEQGNILASNTHIRIREYPHSGGPSTLRRTGKHSLCEFFSNKLIKKFKWTGVAMVEFRFHKYTKKPFLMEINPRFWGSLALDLHSGVDFPKLVSFKLLNPNNKIIKPKAERNIFVRWLFLGDILWLLTHENKIKAFKKFLIFKNQKFDILDKTDPLPVFGSIAEGFLSLFKSKRRNHAFNRGWIDKF